MLVSTNLRLATNFNCAAIGSGTFGVMTDYVDLSVSREIADGEGMSVRIMVTEAFAAGGADFCSFLLLNDSAADFSSVLAPAAHLAQTGYFFASELPLGKVLSVAIPRKVRTAARRYFGVAFYNMSGTFTTGKVTVDIVKDSTDLTAYPNAV